MMGRRKQGGQGQLFYEFRLDGAVPDDYLVRKIRGVLDLSWVYAELTPYYSEIGRPSIDPVLMMQMLIIGYVFAIRSERQICREVQVNLAYRWFCDLGLEDAIPDHSAFSRARNERFRQSDIFRRVFERVVGSHFEAGWSAVSAIDAWAGARLRATNPRHAKALPSPSSGWRPQRRAPTPPQQDVAADERRH
jgi:transposase